MSPIPVPSRACYIFTTSHSSIRGPRSNVTKMPLCHESRVPQILSPVLDSFTVSLHSPSGRQFACRLGCERGTVSGLINLSVSSDKRQKITLVTPMISANTLLCIWYALDLQVSPVHIYQPITRVTSANRSPIVTGMGLCSSLCQWFVRLQPISCTQFKIGAYR